MLPKPKTFDLLEIFIQDCQFRNLSKATIKDYNWFLIDIKKRVGNWSEINRQQIKQIVLDKLNSGQSPASVNHYIRAIKAFFSFLTKESIMKENTMAGLPLVSMPYKLKPVLEPKQVSQLISSIHGDSFFKLRHKIMILILWDTAIRLNELINIKLSDVDFKFRSIKVTGKGFKDRIVPFGLKTKRELTHYMKIRSDNHSEYLFCTFAGHPVMPRNFQRTLSNYGRKIGLKVTPHLLRHSAATFLAKNEMPAQHIQMLLGHSNLATTQRYINQIVNQEGLQISHRRLSPGDRI